MTRWVLDDGPFGALAGVLSGNWDGPCLSLHLSESVAAAATRDKTGRRTNWLSRIDDHGHPIMKVHHLPLHSSAGKIVYEHLRTRSASATVDLGEDESIALCLTDLSDATFVTMDKGAAYQALVELGPKRVSSAFDLWDFLRQEGSVTQQQFEKLCDYVVRRDQGIAGIPLRYRK